MKSRTITGIALFVGGVALGTAAFQFAPNQEIAPTEPAPQTVYGDEQPLGEGTVRTWVRLSADGIPEALGVSVSEQAVETLPTAETLPPPFHMLNLQLELPEEAAVTGFDHVFFDWNPIGHDPMQLYGAPHFDVHFYLIDGAAREAILPTDPEFEAKGMKAPEPDLIPADYISPPGNHVVPQMGTHWLDAHTPELNGQPFSQTMLYGFYDGQMIFVEPMLTIEYLKTKPNLVQAMKQPKRFAKPGYYPTEYTIRYDESEAAYVISIDGLKHHGHEAHGSHSH